MENVYDNKTLDYGGVLNYGRKIKQVSDAVTLLEYRNSTGVGHIYSCWLWDGVGIWLNDVRMRELPTEESDNSCIKINYCIKGRCELQLPNDSFVYVADDQLSVGCGRAKDCYVYPTGGYYGVEIGMLWDSMDERARSIMKSIGFDAEEWSMAFGTVSDELRFMFETLADWLIHGRGTVADYRIAVLNVLHRIAAGGMKPLERQVYLSRGQRQLALSAKQALTHDLREHVTMESLAREYGVSSSSLKKYFSMAYGVAVTEYMQNLRMQRAAELLVSTDMSIGEIAASVGYNHQGKFGVVFKRLNGCAPLEYRRRRRAEGKR